MKNKYTKKFFGLILAVLFCCSSTNLWAEQEGVAEQIKIVTTIKPLALLVQELVNNDDAVQVLLDSKQNNHIELLNSLQKQKVSQADMVFYIHDKFEMFVTSMIESDGIKDKFIKVSDLPGLRLLSLRKSGQMPHTIHSVTKKQTKNKASNISLHNHGGVDWHIWLNPDNAIVILMKIRDELTRMYPENEAIFCFA